jgi:two-component system sensor histidine kinase FlrB
MKIQDTDRMTAEERIVLLNQALYRFDLSASTLRDSYDRLQRQVHGLNLELKQKNEQLQFNLREKEKVEEYLYNILESLSSGVVVVDKAGKVTTYNRSAELITGMPKASVEGAYFIEIMRSLITGDGVPSSIHSGDFGWMAEREFKLRRKDGKDLQVRVSVTRLVRNGKAKVGSVIILQDVSRLRILEEQAERTNRLAAMGEIAVSIAHEVRNPLGSIELLASLLRKELEGDDDKKRVAEHILSGVKSIDYIINNLLLFTKQQYPVFKCIDFHGLLEETLVFVMPTLRQGKIELIKRFNALNPRVRGDSELLKQVVLNLLWNALQAMPQGGKLTVSTETAEKGLGFTHEAGYLTVKFIDSGVGISDHDKEKIFSPFFSTKEKGMGLGLTIAHTITGTHEGMIEVMSTLGEGATFAVTLPLDGEEREE